MYRTSDPPSQAEGGARVPVEVCERVIGAVYDDRYALVAAASATLTRCALVCRAWRSPAQQALFHYVTLRNKDALCSFGELLDASPELAAYVHALELRGHLHVPYSPAVLFPTVLRGRLKNLVEVHIIEVWGEAKAAKPLPEGVKELPTLPIHPLLPSLLANSISHIRSLSLYAVAFPSFGDFARVLHALPNLRELYCQFVSWTVLGQEPRCMTQGLSSGSRNTFLPYLAFFGCTGMDERGRQRLLAAVGPSLRRLTITWPNHAPPKPSSALEDIAVEEQLPSLALDPQSFPQLEVLQLDLVPFPELPHDSRLASIRDALVSLRDTLLSWVASDECVVGSGDSSASQRGRDFRLRLEPNRNSFTREQFVRYLRAIGPVIEGALCSQNIPTGDVGPSTERSEDADKETDPCRATVVVQDLGDRLEWAEWWSSQIRECFPTLARWDRLEIRPLHDDNPDSGFSWKDYEQTPQDIAQTSSTTVPVPLSTQESTTHTDE